MFRKKHNGYFKYIINVFYNNIFKIDKVFVFKYLSLYLSIIYYYILYY